MFSLKMRSRALQEHIQTEPAKTYVTPSCCRVRLREILLEARDGGAREAE